MICSSLYLLVLMSIILRVDGLLGNMNGTVYGEQVMPASKNRSASSCQIQNHSLISQGKKDNRVILKK